MTEGTIVGLTDKGFGFIKVEGMEKDLFFHSKELVGVEFDSLVVGDRVSFEIGSDDRGQHAAKVSKI